MNRPFTIFLLLFTILFTSEESSGQIKPDLNGLFQKENITIVITDSGLGGLSVMNDIAEKLKLSGSFSHVNMIFVNALFDANTGYNSLQSREEKITVLNRVLNGINLHYSPDIILIACNTLSVLYKETDFVNESKTPVIGIVQAGVDLISENLEKYPDSRVIIFGTETTIEEDSHKKALLQQNMNNQRIITKACPQLQSYIEQNPNGEETEMLISAYMSEALESIPNDNGLVFTSLNCSHFGYSEEFWKNAIESSSYKSGGILNPNFTMGNFLMEEKYRFRYPETKITYQVVSKVELLNEKSMFNIFNAKSPELAKAIDHYEIIADLF
ncbi:MAG: aspartate/glutamate racemase family protein [Bacteroidales bacterium]|nr:aspartate/glutamate racemase family protein [Bacteroidales bacterium]